MFASLTLTNDVGTEASPSRIYAANASQHSTRMRIPERAQHSISRRQIRRTSPETRLFASFGDERYRLVEPLMVHIEPEVDYFLAWESSSSVYGVGRTTNEALADFESMLIERFDLLSASSETLSSAMAEQLRYLRRVIAPAS